MFSRISGTTAISGAVDTSLTPVEQERGSGEATLYCIGRAYYHIVQAFSPDDPLDFDTAHEIGCKFAGYFQGHQALVVTHRNTAHIHNHIILNSVSFEDGRKFHQSAREMRQAKEFSNELCRQYDLSITETKADPFRMPKWKEKLRREAETKRLTRQEKLALIKERGC